MYTGGKPYYRSSSIWMMQPQEKAFKTDLPMLNSFWNGRYGNRNMLCFTAEYSGLAGYS